MAAEIELANMKFLFFYSVKVFSRNRARDSLESLPARDSRLEYAIYSHLVCFYFAPFLSMLPQPLFYFCLTLNTPPSKVPTSLC